ncbi:MULTISPECIES: MerR family transcriptional regulator [Vibrio]|uniref:MerR family transcriptional regulator n=1 Tax=Vibrio bivalvicida TaxID=1276888 RepID=A0A177Y1Q3_9VIBR|nr:MULTISPECIES: MerR family transcriptional regulator [Vibrio]KLN63983.1 MerR family transcriptional regulator [Vibrio sp. VPAP30]OAJ94770.1 MerR family transcriptional regulator [Vibrio bivalvicida]
MLTVTQLAKKFGISRTTLLYYEREGLLYPSLRTASGYRQYGQKEIDRLSKIISYRAFGVPVQEISTLLDNNSEKEREQILRGQFSSLGEEIQRLKKQQAAIVVMLRAPSLVSEKPITKEQWTEVMRTSGLNEDDMHEWHKQFELLDPENHQNFLESLGIEEEEINRIRCWSKAHQSK